MTEWFWWARLARITAVVLLCASSALAGEWGGRVGVELTLGTVVRRVGFVAGGFGRSSVFQGNLEVRGGYELAGYGPQVPGWSGKVSVGGAGAFGPERGERDPFYGPVSHQTERRYAFAYAWHYYFDQKGTSQPTGTVALHLGKVLFATENDLLGFRGGDRYRTGAFALLWRQAQTRLGVQSSLWTGDTHGSEKVRESGYPSRYGYKDLSTTSHGKLSHGVFVVMAEREFGAHQQARLAVGVDAEQVRNFLQNRVMHDMPFIPDALMPHENLHVPMISETGEPYLFQEGQRVRPPRFFAEASLNADLFY